MAPSWATLWVVLAAGQLATLQAASGRALLQSCKSGCTLNSLGCDSGCGCATASATPLSCPSGAASCVATNCSAPGCIVTCSSSSYTTTVCVRASSSGSKAATLWYANDTSCAGELEPIPTMAMFRLSAGGADSETSCYYDYPVGPSPFQILPPTTTGGDRLELSGIEFCLSCRCTQVTAVEAGNAMSWKSTANSNVYLCPGKPFTVPRFSTNCRTTIDPTVTVSGGMDGDSFTRNGLTFTFFACGTYTMTITACSTVFTRTIVVQPAVSDPELLDETLCPGRPFKSAIPTAVTTTCGPVGVDITLNGDPVPRLTSISQCGTHEVVITPKLDPTCNPPSFTKTVTITTTVYDPKLTDESTCPGKAYTRPVPDNLESSCGALDYIAEVDDKETASIPTSFDMCGRHVIRVIPKVHKTCKAPTFIKEVTVDVKLTAPQLEDEKGCPNKPFAKAIPSQMFSTCGPVPLDVTVNGAAVDKAPTSFPGCGVFTINLTPRLHATCNPPTYTKAISTGVSVTAVELKNEVACPGERFSEALPAVLASSCGDIDVDYKLNGKAVTSAPTNFTTCGVRVISVIPQLDETCAPPTFNKTVTVAVEVTDPQLEDEDACPDVTLSMPVPRKIKTSCGVVPVETMLNGRKVDEAPKSFSGCGVNTISISPIIHDTCKPPTFKKKVTLEVGVTDPELKDEKVCPNSKFAEPVPSTINTTCGAKKLKYKVGGESVTQAPTSFPGCGNMTITITPDVDDTCQPRSFDKVVVVGIEVEDPQLADEAICPNTTFAYPLPKTINSTCGPLDISVTLDGKAVTKTPTNFTTCGVYQLSITPELDATCKPLAYNKTVTTGDGNPDFSGPCGNYRFKTDCTASQSVDPVSLLDGCVVTQTLKAKDQCHQEWQQVLTYSLCSQADCLEKSNVTLAIKGNATQGIAVPKAQDHGSPALPDAPHAATKPGASPEKQIVEDSSPAPKPSKTESFSPEPEVHSSPTAKADKSTSSSSDGAPETETKSSPSPKAEQHASPSPEEKVQSRPPHKVSHSPSPKPEDKTSSDAKTVDESADGDVVATNTTGNHTAEVAGTPSPVTPSDKQSSTAKEESSVAVEESSKASEISNGTAEESSGPSETGSPAPETSNGRHNSTSSAASDKAP